MEGIVAIQHRMTEIQNLIAHRQPPALPGTTRVGGVLGSGSLSAADFATVLSSVQGSESGFAAAASQLNADGVPLTLAGYGNGRIPETALAGITGSTERMWAPAASQLNKLLADAKADGVTIGVTDGYRTYESQEQLATAKGLYSQGGLAAEPGTSEHGWGLAVDLKLNATSQAWMREHADEYGFTEPLSRESWHWEYHPEQFA